MQTRFYDCEESFRALLLVLLENNIKYVKQNAFEKYLEYVKKYVNEKYDMNATFLGSVNFREFTDFTRGKCVFFNDGQVAVVRNIKEQEIQEGLYHKKMLEAAQSEGCRSVFGLSTDKKLNNKNYCNKLNEKEKAEIQNHIQNSKKPFFEF